MKTFRPEYNVDELVDDESSSEDSRTNRKMELSSKIEEQKI